MAIKELSEPQVHAYAQHADAMMERNAQHLVGMLAKAFAGK